MIVDFNDELETEMELVTETKVKFLYGTRKYRNSGVNGFSEQWHLFARYPAKRFDKLGKCALKYHQPITCLLRQKRNKQRT